MWPLKVFICRAVQRKLVTEHHHHLINANICACFFCHSKLASVEMGWCSCVHFVCVFVAKVFYLWCQLCKVFCRVGVIRLTWFVWLSPYWQLFSRFDTLVKFKAVLWVFSSVFCPNLQGLFQISVTELVMRCTRNILRCSVLSFLVHVPAVACICDELL